MNKFKLILIFSLLSTATLADNAPRTIRIAAGGIMKSYYEVAIKLCNFFEESNPNLKCSVRETGGSRENIELLKAGKVDFAFSQSDIAVYAFGGEKCYDNPNLNLRQILKLYEEVFTIITKDDDHIKTFADLAGKNITNGPDYAGSSITYDEVRSLYNFASPHNVNMSPEDYARKLCSGEIDAVVLVAGHPNRVVNHITSTCNVEFVAVEPEKLAELMGRNKAYHKAILHKDTYQQISEDQQTIGVSAILLTNDSMDDQIIDNFMTYFKNHMNEFKQSNLMLQNLPDEYFTTGFVLPMHDQCTPEKSDNK
jgi:uncharacterized protein